MRSLTADADAALAASGLCLCILLELYFDGETLYLCSLNRDLVWSGNTYKGVGSLGSIDAVEEGAEVQPYGLTLSLSGIDPTMMAIILGQQYQGRKCILRCALLDSNHQVIDDPILIFRGRIDQPKINLGSTATITLTVENRLADWDRPRVRRFNDQDQRRTSPNDTFFQYVAQMVAEPLNWGVPGATPSNPLQAAINQLAANIL